MFQWKKLYKAIDSVRAGVSWRTLSKRVGVVPSTFTRISQGNPISVENLIRVISLTKEPFDSFIKQS